MNLNINELTAVIADPGKWAGMRGIRNMPTWQADAVEAYLKQAWLPKTWEETVAAVEAIKARVKVIVREDARAHQMMQASMVAAMDEMPDCKRGDDWLPRRKALDLAVLAAAYAIAYTEHVNGQGVS